MAVRADDVDLSDPDFWARPLDERHAAYAVLRRDRPLGFFAEPPVPFLEPGPGYYAVVRHADVETVSRQPALFRSSPSAVSIADLPIELSEFYGSLINMDAPRHLKIRRIVSQAFTPRVLAGLADDVEALARRLVAAARDEALAGDGTFDLVREIAAPLPLMVICRMLGIPEDEHDLVLAQTEVVLSGGDPELVPDPDEALTLLLNAGGALAGIMERLAAERLERPTGDLTSALVRSEVDGERLTHQEIASFFILLCVAGNETTRTAISHGVLALDRFPDQAARWRADPALSRTAVEELVRWASPVTWMRRTATEDTVLGGQQLRAGDKLVLFYAAANRDESVFARPEQFDAARSPNPHLGFGAAGPHVCLGAHLARRELDVTFRVLSELLPDLRVAGPADHLRSSFVNGVKRLPVRVGDGPSPSSRRAP